MKTRFLTILFLIICSLFGVTDMMAQPRAPKVYKRSMPIPPPPPVRPLKKINGPKIFTPVGHIYGLSMPGHNIIFHINPNGRVYREGDNIGCPFTMKGDVITVYSSHGPHRVIGTGKISRDGKKLEWLNYSTGEKYRLRLIG